MKVLATVSALALVLTVNLVIFSRPAIAAVTSPGSAVVVWDGHGAGWTNPTTSTIQPEATDVHDGKTALEFRFSGNGHWLGAGWNWLGFKKGPFGTDISKMLFLTFWVKSTGTVADLQINLLSNGKVADTPAHHTDKVHLSAYCSNLTDGTWHLVKIPLSALTQPQGFDAEHVCELQLGLTADHPLDGSYILDGIAFER
ncbi:MAG: hypothetical protein ACLQVD_20290 [Capsulimonadaceae bacterium]